MPRSFNQKKKLSVLRSILLERSDENHPLTMKDIISELDANGISAERKSIYDDLENLRELGLDVRVVRSKTTGYYVAKREFDLPELKLLADSIVSSKFVPKKNSEQLIKKLSAFANVHDRKALNREVFVSDRAKNVNEDIFSTVDIIHEAIENNKTISFAYFNWTAKKEKELRRNGARYFISPWSLVLDDSNYYLLGFDNEKGELRHFRIDKMLNPAIIDQPRSGKEEFLKYDLNSYSGAVFGMFGGKPERITLSCENRLANVIIDRFGSDIVIYNEEDRFRTTVQVVKSPVFYGWVMSFGGGVEILAPESIRKEYFELLQKSIDYFKEL